MRDWYFDTPPARANTRTITWIDILESWDPLEVDLHREYGIDVESDLLQHRTWRWLSIRIADLVDDPTSRIGRALRAPSKGGD